MTMNNQDITLPPDYKPSESEEYMNSMQLAYFRKKLVDWAEKLREESHDTVETMKELQWHQPDITDQAMLNSEAAFELRTRDRYRKLLEKIKSAIVRIDNKTYGYCEETGEPIGIKRLEARPIATLSLDAQEEHERFERTHSEDD